MRNEWNKRVFRLFSNDFRHGDFQMEPVYYVIAILGCADGSAQCTPVATMPTHYASQTACTAGTQQALITNSNFDFPTLVAECRATDPRTVAQQDEPAKAPIETQRG
jgi:hypothetical protein